MIPDAWVSRAAGVATGLAAIVATVWAAMTFAMDSRYVTQDGLTDAIETIREDRIRSDIRNAETRLAITIMAESYAESPEWETRRRKEREIIEAEIESLERELKR